MVQSIRRRLLLVALVVTAPLAAACHMPTAAGEPGDDPGQSDSTHRDLRPWG